MKKIKKEKKVKKIEKLELKEKKPKEKKKINIDFKKIIGPILKFIISHKIFTIINVLFGVYEYYLLGMKF